MTDGNGHPEHDEGVVDPFADGFPQHETEAEHVWHEQAGEPHWGEHAYHEGEFGHEVAHDPAYDQHDPAYDHHDPAYDHHPLTGVGEGQHELFGPETRRSRREGRAPRRGRRFLVLLLALGLVGGAGYLGFTALKPLLNRTTEVADYPGPGGAAVTFTVNDGDTGRTIATNLEKAGIVRTAKAFVDACNDDSRCAAIQPGDYALKKEMRAADILAILVDPKNRQNGKVTIREGLWANEIYALLGKATGHPVSDYQAAAKSPEVLGLLPPSAKGIVEGYLFPATYEFSSKDSAVVQLKAMVAKTAATLTQLNVPADQAERIMTIASIVEAEARRDEDRPKVARVILNRLAKPMRLQLDSTVSYGVQKRALTTTDAERATVNAWNTYTKDGLPDTPIANPGVAAIQAAANPAEGAWLFFVAVNPETGETKFATTQSEHDQYVAEFQAWCQKPENKGKCSSS